MSNSVKNSGTLFTQGGDRRSTSPAHNRLVSLHGGEEGDLKDFRQATTAMRTFVTETETITVGIPGVTLPPDAPLRTLKTKKASCCDEKAFRALQEEITEPKEVYLVVSFFLVEFPSLWFPLNFSFVHRASFISLRPLRPLQTSITLFLIH